MQYWYFIHSNRVGGVLVGVPDSIMVWSLGLVKPKAIKLVCAALGSISTDWMARNQDNVSEWSNRFSRRLLFQ